MAPPSRYGSVLRYRHLVLGVIATILVLATASERGFDLDILWYGARGLAGHSTAWFGPQSGPSTGLHLYAANPGIQVGPLALLFVLGFGAAWGDPGHLACLATTLLGLVAVALIERSASQPGRAVSARVSALTLLGGAAICISWADTVERWGHIDDALVAFAAVAAVLALRRDRRAVAGALIGLAIAAKPTALPLVTLLLTGPGEPLWPVNRSRLRAVAIAAAVTAAAYLPFVIADSRTLRAATPQLAIAANSVIALFGATVGSSPTALLRLAQLAAGVGLGFWAARRNGPMACLLAVSAGRLLLDPGGYSYYALPLIVGAVGVAVERGHLPTLAWLAAAVLVIMPWADPGEVNLRSLPALVVCVAAVVTGVRRTHESVSHKERGSDRRQALAPAGQA